MKNLLILTMLFFASCANLAHQPGDIYQTPPKNQSEAVALNYMRVLLRDSLREDVNTTEASQQNLNAGIMQGIPLSQQEVVLRHRYKVVERWLAEAK